MGLVNPVTRWENPTLGLKVGDRRGSRKEGNFFLLLVFPFVLEKQLWVMKAMDGLTIFALVSCMLPIYSLQTVFFCQGKV